MSVAKRKDGRWLVKFKDTDGRWKQRSFRMEEDARRFDAECQYDAAENQRLTLLEVVLAYVKNRRLSERAVSIYRYLVCGNDWKNGTHKEGPAEVLATKYADSLTRLDLETVRENCRRNSVCVVTMNGHIGKLKAALNWAVEQDLLTVNPWAKYRNVQGGKSKPRSDTLEDFARLYPVLPAWLQWASKTAIALCLRPGEKELFSLRWKSFDWQTQSVAVYMSKVDNTKIVYPPVAYMAEAWERFQEDERHGYELVCRSRGNRQVFFSMYISAWNRACRKAGVKMPMYALRHIAASQMLAGGADLAAVAAQLGHKNITTTAEFYLHALPAAQRQAAAALPDCTKMVRNGAGIQAKSKR